MPHIGILVDQKSRGSSRYVIVHNPGEGAKKKSFSTGKSPAT